MLPSCMEGIMNSGSALALAVARDDVLRGVLLGSCSRCLAPSVCRALVAAGGGVYSSSPSLSTTHESPNCDFDGVRADVRSLTILILSLTPNAFKGSLSSRPGVRISKTKSTKSQAHQAHGGLQCRSSKEVKR